MNLDPHKIAEERMELAGEYSRLTEQLGNILEVKPTLWNELRKGTKSDTSADRMWEGTPKGIEEMKIKGRLRSIEKELSAKKSYLDVLINESHNNF